MDASRVVYLVDLAGRPLVSLAGATWTLEDREGSTNELVVELPLDMTVGVVTDMEALLAGRRFSISELVRDRSGRIAAIRANEVQAELTANALASFKLEGATLSQALDAALRGSRWVPYGALIDSGTYYSDLEDINSMSALRFLQSQSGKELVFDSALRRVSFVDPEEKVPDRVLTYGVGVDGIKKTESPPEITVLFPFGKDGLHIGAINGGRQYIEDFGWYTAQGLTPEQARARFTRSLRWTDERYIYSVNLKRDAERRLRELAYPKINYTLSVVPSHVSGLSLGDPVWVVDEQLGMKLSTRVVRVVDSSDPSRVELELGYLPNTVSGDISGDTNSRESREAMFLAKNVHEEQLDNIPRPVVQMQISTYADTGFQVGTSVQVHIDAPGLLRGYYLLNGQRVDPEIRFTAPVGWWTVGQPFLLTNIPAGPTTLDLYMHFEGVGGATIPPVHAEMYVVARGAYGGINNAGPDRSVTDHIGEWLHPFNLSDSATVDVSLPILVESTEFVDLSMALDVVSDAFVGYEPGPELSVVGATLTLTYAPPNKEYRISVEGVVAGTITCTPAGEFSGDLGIIFGLEPGEHECRIEETGQLFTITVL